MEVICRSVSQICQSHDRIRKTCTVHRLPHRRGHGYAHSRAVGSEFSLYDRERVDVVITDVELLLTRNEDRHQAYRQ